MSAAPSHTMDDAVFAVFLAAAQPAARQLLRRLCGGDEDAEDLLQETLTKVWRLRGSFDPTQNGIAWLQQAAFRCFCDQRRRQQRQPRSVQDVDAVPAPDASTRESTLERRDELRHRLAALPELERQLLLGFHAAGRSLRQLADEHGMPVNTVKSHLHRARRRLQQGKEPT